MSLAEKLRKAREVRLEQDDFVLICRRPTDLEMIELRGNRAGRALLPFVVGWERVSEQVITGNGAPHPLPFDEELRDEWLVDRLDLLGKVAEAVFTAYEAHVDKVADAVKN